MLLQPTEEEKKEYLAYKEETDFFENMENGLRALKRMSLPRKEHVVCICGGMAGFDKGLLHFLNVYGDEEKRNGRNLLLLSEVTAEYRRYTAEKIKFPFLCTPHLLAKEIIVLGLRISVSQAIQEYIKERPFVQEAILLMRARHPKLGDGYAEAWAYYASVYIEEFLRKTNPEKVILWNQFYAFHRIFASICKEKNIQIEYMEFGCLPGSIVIEKRGQMGESEVAVNFKKFRRLPVYWYERKEMKAILKYLQESRLNRNEQPQQFFEKQQIYLFKANNPLLVYFGQNDFESGIFPYTRFSKEKHSPVFESTTAALEYLINLSIKNSWNFVYKPHPIAEALGLEYLGMREEQKKYMVSDVDISSLLDCADVCITIFSQSAYISLIRNKPVVMLGFSQLKGKKCTYEAFNKEKIEKELKKAIYNGFTLKQKRAFLRHCTQLKKYYLMDDLQEKQGFSMGRKIVKGDVL